MPRPRSFAKNKRPALWNLPVCGEKGLQFAPASFIIRNSFVQKEDPAAMRIALIAHDSRKELMTQFCTAYVRILSENELVATGVTGKLVAEATGLPVRCLYPGNCGGAEQISAMIACGEVDMLLFFRDPGRRARRRTQRRHAAAPVRYPHDPGGDQHRHGRSADPRPGARGPRLDRSPARPQINKPNKQTKHALPLCGRAYLAYAGDHSAPAGRMRPMPWMRSIKKPDTVTVTSDQTMRCTGR